MKSKILAVFAIGGILVANCATAGATSIANHPKTKQQLVRVRPNVKKSFPEIGNSFRNGQFRVTIIDVRYGIKSVGSDGVFVSSKGQFCAVRLSLVNISKKPAFYSSDSDIAYDSSGRQFAFNDDDIDADDAGNNFANGNSGMDGATINPTYSLTGNLYFEIPSGDRLKMILLFTAYLPTGSGQDVLLKH